MIPVVTMGLDLEASTLAMDRPLQASLASIPPAMPPPRLGPRPLVSPSFPLVTPDIGWRGQEERPLATGPGPLTQEAQEVQDTGPMAPATMGPATLLATPQLLASIQEAPQEVTVDPLDTAQRGTVITIPLVTDRSSLRMWRPRALMASLCTTRQASSPHCPSHQTTQGADKLPRGTMARATPPPPALLTAPPPPAAWAPLKMTSCPRAPLTQAGVTADLPRPRPRTPQDHRPRSRTSRGFTRSTITPTGRPGWTSCSPSWRSAALRSPSVRPFPRTLSICTSCTCTPRIGEGSLSAPTRKPGKILQPNWG